MFNLIPTKCRNFQIPSYQQREQTPQIPWFKATKGYQTKINFTSTNQWGLFSRNQYDLGIKNQEVIIISSKATVALIYGSMFTPTMSSWDELSHHGFLFLVVVGRWASWYCSSSFLHLHWLISFTFLPHSIANRVCLVPQCTMAHQRAVLHLAVLKTPTLCSSIGILVLKNTSNRWSFTYNWYRTTHRENKL